ncbi:MAG TPA: metalloregulator ArsR/SmtB family transcription factor [Chloroflexota bacterium]
MSIYLPVIDLPRSAPAPWQPDPELEAAAALFRVLGDPRRLELLRLLALAERCVCEFQESLGWPQNLISHHLGALRRAGLVQARRDAQWVYYSLVPDGYASARRLVGDTLGPIKLPAAARFGAAPRRC